MFALTPAKILIIAAIILIFIGYRKLPEVGKGLGQALRNFRKSVGEPDEIDITPEEKKAGEPGDAAIPPLKSAPTQTRRSYRVMNRAAASKKR